MTIALRWIFFLLVAYWSLVPACFSGSQTRPTPHILVFVSSLFFTRLSSPEVPVPAGCYFPQPLSLNIFSFFRCEEGRLVIFVLRGPFRYWMRYGCSFPLRFQTSVAFLLAFFSSNFSSEIVMAIYSPEEFPWLRCESTQMLSSHHESFVLLHSEDWYIAVPDVVLPCILPHLPQVRIPLPYSEAFPYFSTLLYFTVSHDSPNMKRVLLACSSSDFYFGTANCFMITRWVYWSGAISSLIIYSISIPRFTAMISIEDAGLYLSRHRGLGQERSD